MSENELILDSLQPNNDFKKRLKEPLSFGNSNKTQRKVSKSVVFTFGTEPGSILLIKLQRVKPFLKHEMKSFSEG